MQMTSWQVRGSWQELMALGRSGELPALPVSLRPLADAGGQALEDLRLGQVRGRTVLCA